MTDWRKNLYLASIVLGIVGILAALIIYSMLNGAIDGIAGAAYAALNSTNQTVGSVESAVNNAEGFVNATDDTLNSLKGSLSPLSSGLSGAGDALGAVSGFVAQLPGGGFLTGGLDSASASLKNSSSRVAQTDTALEAQTTNFGLLRDSIEAIRTEVDGSRAAIASAKIALDEAVSALKTVALLFFVMNAAMFLMQMLNAYAGLKSLP